MQTYSKRIERLLDKVYLSRLSISNYSFYYGNLLKNLNFKLTDEEFHRVIEDDCFYLYEKMVEKENPTKIALFIISEFEKFIDEIGACSDGIKTPSANIRKDCDEDFVVDGKNGKKQKANEFWKNKIQETVALVGGEESLSEIPSNARVFIERKKKEKINWRDELKKYIIKDISDYSFNPPDKRYMDSDFYLPAFNDETEKLENILFMIDVSGSMKDEVINDVFNEVKNVKDQFRGKVDGYVGWFDTYVRDVKNMNEVIKIESLQRENIDGTSFVDIFKYKRTVLGGIDFKAIIILTDGYGEFPSIKMVGDTPVIWVLTKENIKTPFGEIIRYTKTNTINKKV